MDFANDESMSGRRILLLDIRDNENRKELEMTKQIATNVVSLLGYVK